MIATLILAWLVALAFIGVFMSGARRVAAARNAAAQQYWNSEGRVIAQAQAVINDAARDLERER